MPDAQYVIGIDYGTDSVRSVVTDTTDGRKYSRYGGVSVPSLATGTIL